MLLYIFSSLLFIILSGYWYYTAQKNALSSENYHSLEHIADAKSRDIIMAHMQGMALTKRKIPQDIELALIDTKGKVREGQVFLSSSLLKPGYVEENGYSILISDAPQKHLDIAYILVQSKGLFVALHDLKFFVWQVMFFVALLTVLIAWILSKLFMRPLRQRIDQVESFINDITHELNTPITALTMATNQALKKEHCSDKMLKNISISTKQLYDIYSTLSYLNFDAPKEESNTINIAQVLETSVLYYTPLCESKGIRIELEIDDFSFKIPQVQLSLVYGNLIGNAIKYSAANSSITISLQEGVLRIKDQGIGIAVDKQKHIFDKFQRATSYSGGFGVGLNIVKRICDEYGIAISLESEVGEGTVFGLDFT